MKIAIMGIGRSGTTVLYHLLQELLTDTYGDKLEFAYEPFLWDRDTFNVMFEEVGNRPQYMESLSAEGIYNNQKLPLFIQHGRTNKNAYISGLFEPRKQKNTLLLKFIRASGRFRLLQATSPECKFIFIIRNPVDVINSVLNMFSFFGEDFHKSDFPRFIDEVNEIYNTELNKDSITDPVERATLYWYYMNRFALESFVGSSNPPLLICFEHFIKNKTEYIQKICQYIDIPYKDIYSNFLKRNVGPSYSTSSITHGDLCSLENYLLKYQNLLSQYHIQNQFNAEKITQKHKGKVRKKRVKDKCFGKTPLFIKKQHNRDLQPRKTLHVGLNNNRLINFYNNIKSMWHFFR